VIGTPAARGRHRELSQARSAETRARILQTAREAFAEHGFAAANIREIAKEAGTTHSMITYHFGSKDNLWREAVRDMFMLLEKQVINPLVAELGGELDLRSTLRNFVHRYTRYCAAHPEHARMTIAESIRGGERLEWMVQEFVIKHHLVVVPWLEDMMRAGVIHQMPVHSMLYSLVGMVQVPPMLTKEADLAGQKAMMTEDSVARHAESVLQFLQPGTLSA